MPFFLSVKPSCSSTHVPPLYSFRRYRTQVGGVWVGGGSVLWGGWMGGLVPVIPCNHAAPVWSMDGCRPARQVLIAAVKQAFHPYLFIYYTPTPQQHANSLRSLPPPPPPPPLCLANKTEVMKLRLEFVCLGSQGSDNHSESISWLLLNVSWHTEHFLQMFVLFANPLFSFFLEAPFSIFQDFWTSENGSERFHSGQLPLVS